VAQSPKLGKMAEVAERDHRAWDSAAIHAPHKEMLDRGLKPGFKNA
jgi:hypothetical protein